MLNPREISEKTFDKTFGFGYRMDDVDAYLKEAAASLTEQIEINADLEKKLEVLAEKLTEYREDEESLRSALLGAQKLGDSVIRESKTKAEIIMRDATIKADTMVNNAKRQIEREQEALAKIEKEVASFKNRLLDLYKQHLELISGLPGSTDRREQEPTPTPPEELPAEPEVLDEMVSEQPPQDDPPLGAAPERPQIQRPAFFALDGEEDEDLDGGAQQDLQQQNDSQKFGELQFGEAFKLKRDGGFPKYKK
jgi:DivIVA domain-containing protein